MDLELRKNDNRHGHIWQPYGIGSTGAKLIASKDISKDCGKGKLFSKNYLMQEYKITQMLRHAPRALYIDDFRIE